MSFVTLYVMDNSCEIITYLGIILFLYYALEDIMNVNRQILLTLFLLCVSIYFFGRLDIDTLVQDYLYDFNTNQWILSHDIIWKLFFYSGIKKLLIIFAVSLLICLMACWKKEWMVNYKKGIIVVILSAIFVPATINLLKKETNMPCPKNELRYGGIYPKTAVWESYTLEYKNKPHIRCWPAGHASGGFALMSLFFLFRKKRHRYMALFSGIVIGWIMGGYKMLIGDHFLSHTVITMILAWFIILIITRFIFGNYVNIAE